MVYQQLVDYVRGARAAGYSDDEVRDRLVDAGWTREDIADAISLAGKLGEKQFSQPKQTPALKEVPEETIAPPIVETPTAQEQQRRPRMYESARTTPAGMAQELTSSWPSSHYQGQNAAGGEEIAKPMTISQALDDDESQKGFAPVKAWFECIVRPSETFRRGRYHASYKWALAGFFLPPLIVGALITAAFALFASQLPSALAAALGSSGIEVAGMLAAALAGGTVLLAGAALVIAFSWLVLGVFSNLIPFAGAKLLKGSGSFKQQLYLNSLAWAANAFLLILILPLAAAGGYFFVSGTTGGGIALLAAAGLLALYAMVGLQLMAFKTAHSFSWLKTIAGLIVFPTAVSFISSTALSLLSASLLAGRG